MNDVIELAWAAGFFDGEGCITVGKGNYNAGNGAANIQLSLDQVDRRPLDRFVQAVGHGKVSGPRWDGNEKHKPQYQWVISSKTKTLEVLELIFPYLSPPKQEQAIRVYLEMVELNEIKPPGKPGGINRYNCAPNRVGVTK